MAIEDAQSDAAAGTLLKPPVANRTNRWSRAAWILLVLYWLAMFAGSHDPDPPTLPSENFDKFLHFTGFGLLAVLLSIAWSLRSPMTLARYLTVICVIAAYGAFDELTQWFIATRSCDFFDWCADVTGAIVGAISASIVIRAWRRYRTSEL